MQACQDRWQPTTVLVEDRRGLVRSFGPAGGSAMAFARDHGMPARGGQGGPVRPTAGAALPGPRAPAQNVSHPPGHVAPVGRASFPKPSPHHGFEQAATAQELATGPGAWPRGIGHSVTAATRCACPGFVQPYAAPADVGRWPRGCGQPGYQRPHRRRATDPGDHTHTHRRRCGPGGHPVGHHRCE
jgi:hypothetical protein